METEQIYTTSFIKAAEGLHYDLKQLNTQINKQSIEVPQQFKNHSDLYIFKKLQHDLLKRQHIIEDIHSHYNQTLQKSQYDIFKYIEKEEELQTYKALMNQEKRVNVYKESCQLTEAKNKYMSQKIRLRDQTSVTFYKQTNHKRLYNQSKAQVQSQILKQVQNRRKLASQRRSEAKQQSLQRVYLQKQNYQKKRIIAMSKKNRDNQLKRDKLNYKNKDMFQHTLKKHSQIFNHRKEQFKSKIAHKDKQFLFTHQNWKTNQIAKSALASQRSKVFYETAKEKRQDMHNYQINGFMEKIRKSNNKQRPIHDNSKYIKQRRLTALKVQNQRESIQKDEQQKKQKHSEQVNNLLQQYKNNRCMLLDRQIKEKEINNYLYLQDTLKNKERLKLIRKDHCQKLNQKYNKIEKIIIRKSQKFQVYKEKIKNYKTKPKKQLQSLKQTQKAVVNKTLQKLPYFIKTKKQSINYQQLLKQIPENLDQSKLHDLSTKLSQIQFQHSPNLLQQLQIA